MTKRHVDWQQLASTALTGELASRLDPKIPVTLASKRIYFALHEAAHLVTAVRYDVPVHNVALINLRGRFSYLNEPARCVGAVRTYYTADIANAAVALAGFAFESLFCQSDTNIAATEDLLAGLQTLREAAQSPLGGAFRGASEEDLQPEVERIRREVYSLLVEKWAVVDACATAFLLFTDARGVLDSRKTGELIGHLRSSLGHRMPMSCRSRTPDQLAGRLGSDITTHWRGFVCIDDTAKFDARAKQVAARHGLDDSSFVDKVRKFELGAHTEKLPT